MNAESTVAPSDTKDSQGLVHAGYVFAVLMPIIGFFIGLALMIRGRAAHGVAAMVLSVLTVVVVVSLLAASASQEIESYSSCLDRSYTLAEMEACEYE